MQAARPQPVHVHDAPVKSRVPGRWVEAANLQVGDVLLLREGGSVCKVSDCIENPSGKGAGIQYPC